MCEFLFVIQNGQYDEHLGSSSVSDCTSCESLEEALMSIGVEEHLRILQREQLDMESLVGFFPPPSFLFGPRQLFLYAYTPESKRIVFIPSVIKL